ncbi:hypothetical protein FTO70_02050 [Methanosarcina sp. KYL-1]|uniref:hypothetical protein n=1 Tax=Methanosarcina sp. KYL-1 TaxID=2602068 RepID=UPI0021015C5A|nr:hypothetical protein [Methanosarcina sp. KYL-1]MCQ1534497.1 hypothetical protein [Methanosarcina sp. KYL-1]
MSYPKNKPKNKPKIFEPIYREKTGQKMKGKKIHTADSKFWSQCTSVKGQEKFPSVMVYGMISPNDAANTCQHADMEKNKKGNSSENWQM